MADNLRSVMTHDQAAEYFNAEILPAIKEQFEQDGDADLPARREEWNNWTDSLCKNEQISDWQYNNWTHPNTCEG